MHNDRLREVLFQELKEFIDAHGIYCAVLNGVDPETGSIGRDIDLYVPIAEQRALLLNHFTRLLGQHGFRWVISMHPIWGQRVVGVYDEQGTYMELHTISCVTMGPVAGTQVFPIDRSGLFQPGISFFKSILMANLNAIIRMKEIHIKSSHHKLALVHETAIVSALKPFVFFPHAYWKSLLFGQGAFSQGLRLLGTLNLLTSFVCRYPLTSFRHVALSLKRKVEAYNAPCTGPVTIATSLELSHLHQSLEAHAGHIFTSIQVLPIERRLPLLSERNLLARQALVVYVDDRAKSRCDDLTLAPFEITKLALDQMVEINRKHDLPQNGPIVGVS